MIPNDARLYTWVDVDDVLFRNQQEEAWEDWLVWIRTYWDGLTIGIKPNKKKEAIQWLNKIFESFFVEEKMVIKLLSIPEKERVLEVFIEETDDAPQTPKFVPSFTRPTILSPPSERKSPEKLDDKLPPIVTFHSLKGGVGKTSHAIALAASLAKKGQKVLLIDADLEAPGISWLIKSKIPNPIISFTDFLELVHSDFSEFGENSIALTTLMLKDSQIDNIFVLPAFRSYSQFCQKEITPEHLLHGGTDSFTLTRLLAQLGKALDVTCVIVDLRAGLSEISSGLILDPRVYRVFVSTLSSQSLEGTQNLIKLIGKIAPSQKEYEPLPTIIISQIPEPYRDEKILAAKIDPLVDESKQLWRKEESSNDNEEDVPLFLNSYFNQNLLVSSNKWDEFIKNIKESEFTETVNQLQRWLPPILTKEKLILREEIPEENLQNQRKTLADYSNQLIFAEKAQISDFLTIKPVKNLAERFRVNIPIAIIVGAKGAGKTYIYMQIVRRKYWQKFGSDSGVMDISTDAIICPVTQSKLLEDDARIIVKDSKINCVNNLGFTNICENHVIKDHIENGFKLNLHEGEWRERWLDIFAWSAGYEINKPNVWKNFLEYLNHQNKKVVVILDGLEDIFTDISTDKNKQLALRSLLREIPEFLSLQPNRNLGIISFIRYDMVINSIKVNQQQFLALYEPFSLKWSSEEALRLVLWIVKKSKSVPIEIEELKIQDLSKEDLIKSTIPLWGMKLGSDTSREASSAEWVITALSDLRGHIQARDLVRFLNTSAMISIKNPTRKDRLLVPPAIRQALKECSKKKIVEVEEEYAELKEIFGKLQGWNVDEKIIPFSNEKEQLALSDIQKLENNGVLIRDKDEYYIPEIFREGLGFKLASGARPRVLILARRAQKWNE